MAELRAVIFDLDNTLIDWSGMTADWSVMESRHVAGVCEYVRSLGYSDFADPITFSNEFRRRTSAKWHEAGQSMRAPHLGETLLETVEHFGVKAGTLTERQALESYRWGAPEGTKPFPEVPDFMEQLHNAGIKVGIVTNAYQPMWLRDIEMHAHGLLDWFPDCRISAADIGYLKPHPTIFQASLDCLGVQPDEAVFVGDDPQADIAGANGIGMKCALRITEFYRGHEGTNPDAIIHNLTELLPHLDAWFPGWRGVQE